MERANPLRMLDYLNKRTGAVTLSVISNTVLILLKIAIGLYTGSVSIISEAIHSSTDLLAALIAFFAIRTAARPADANHPYGHGKAESLAAAFEALLIVAAAILIIYEATNRLIHGAEIQNVEWGIAVMAFSSAANFVVSRHLFRVAKRTESPALAADAWHLATDLYTALGVGIGLLIVRLTGVKAFDPLVAIFVALFILKAAWDITRGAIADLMDESLSEEEENKVRAVLEANKEKYSRVRVMRSRRGGGTRRIYIALEFPPSVSMSDAHSITEQLEQEIRKQFRGAEVIVEAEAPPVRETTETVVQSVQRIARRLDIPVHHIRAYKSDGKFDLVLHLEVPESLSLDAAHDEATRLEQALHQELAGIGRVDTHIEPARDEMMLDGNQTRAQARIEAVMREMEKEVPAVAGVHDIQVRRNDGSLSVSLHCALRGEVPIAEAHRISSQIEAKLKSEFPNLQSVIVHMEPEDKA